MTLRSTIYLWRLVRAAGARNDHTNVPRAFKALDIPQKLRAALGSTARAYACCPDERKVRVRGARRGCLRLRAGLSCLPMLLQPAHRPTASVPHTAARVLCTGENGLKKDVRAAGVLALRARPVSRAPRRLSAALRCVCAQAQAAAV